MNKDQINPDYFEFILKKALDEYAEEEGKRLQMEQKNIEEINFSKKYNKSIRQIQKCLAKKENGIKSKKIMKVAVVLFFLLFSGTAVTYHADANFQSFFNQLFTKEETHSNMTYNQSNLAYDFSQIPDDWEYFYIPEYIPSGYRVDEMEIKDTLLCIHYVNGENSIDFEQRTGDSKISMDNEHSEIKEIDISGNTGYLQKHELLTILYWNNHDMTFTLSGLEDEKELIKIAESISIIGR